MLNKDFPYNPTLYRMSFIPNDKIGLSGDLTISLKKPNNSIQERKYTGVPIKLGYELFNEKLASNCIKIYSTKIKLKYQVIEIKLNDKKI